MTQTFPPPTPHTSESRWSWSQWATYTTGLFVAAGAVTAIVLAVIEAF